MSSKLASWLDRRVVDEPARRQILLMGPRTVLFAERGSAAVGRHAHPAWKLVLALGGAITVEADRHPRLDSLGVLVPPQLPHRARVTGDHLAVFFDAGPWGLGPSGRVSTLRAPDVLALVRHFSEVDPSTLDEASAAAIAWLRRGALLAPARPVDGRVAHAVARLSSGHQVNQVALEVGVSPSRLRTLVGLATGAGPAQVRSWARLRHAMRWLQDHPPAFAAAASGFADQAHLTRVARRLVGRTPGSVAALRP